MKNCTPWGTQKCVINKNVRGERKNLPKPTLQKAYTAMPDLQKYTSFTLNSYSKLSMTFFGGAFFSSVKQIVSSPVFFGYLFTTNKGIQERKKYASRHLQQRTHY